MRVRRPVSCPGLWAGTARPQPGTQCTYTGAMRAYLLVKRTVVPASSSLCRYCTVLCVMRPIRLQLRISNALRSLHSMRELQCVCR